MTGMPADVNADSIFIEIDPRDRSAERALATAGFTKYLGISRDTDWAARLQSDAPASKYAATSDRRWVLYNNADVLLLSGRSGWYVWKYRDVRHAQYVAWKLSWRPSALLATVGWLVRYFAKQYSKPSLLKLGKDTPTYLLARVVRRKRCHHDALHFIPYRLQLGGMFRAFHQMKAKYAVLRWFETLPQTQPRGDVDLLVADEDFDRVLKLLNSAPAFQPCDVYTPSGLPGSSHLTASYYPPLLARRILVHSRTHHDYCQVPDEWHYFHSLAYHAVYHKGPESNLPGAETFRRRGRKSSHDFVTLFEEMAARLNVQAEISLEGLHRYLKAVGWGPSPDLIVRLAAAAPKNLWLKSLAESVEAEHSITPGLAVFIIRQSAVEAGVAAAITQKIAQHGFVVLAEKKLSPKEIEHGSPRTRGGNWGPGPGDHLGGAPDTLVAAYDPAPMQPSRSQRKRFPLLRNARLLAKEAIRRQINAEIHPRRPINGVHSSDHDAEAHYFLQVFAPELIEPITQKIGVIAAANTARHAA